MYPMGFLSGCVAAMAAPTAGTVKQDINNLGSLTLNQCNSLVRRAEAVRTFELALVSLSGFLESNKQNFISFPRHAAPSRLERQISTRAFAVYTFVFTVLVCGYVSLYVIPVAQPTSL